MNAFARRVSFVLLGLITVYMFIQNAQAMPGKYMQTIDTPFYDGYPLNYCFMSGKKCGQFAADQYCQDRGFFHAKAFRRNHGHASASKWMSTGKVCHGRYCDNFSSITCEGLKKLVHPIYVPDPNRGTHVISRPNLFGDRLDSCAIWNVDCAWRTANTYCHMHGFKKAANIERWKHAGPTRALDNDTFCNNREDCNAYHWIRCERYHRV